MAETVYPIGKTLRFLRMLLVAVASLALLSLTLMIVADTFFRYVFATPFPASVEISQLIQPYVVFLPLAYALATGSHVRVTLLTERMSGTLRKRVALVSVRRRPGLLFHHGVHELAQLLGVVPHQRDHARRDHAVLVDRQAGDAARHRDDRAGMRLSVFLLRDRRHGERRNEQADMDPFTIGLLGIAALITAPDAGRSHRRGARLRRLARHVGARRVSSRRCGGR